MPLEKRKVATHANAPRDHSIPGEFEARRDVNSGPGRRPDSAYRPDFVGRPAVDRGRDLDLDDVSAAGSRLLPAAGFREILPAPAEDVQGILPPPLAGRAGVVAWSLSSSSSDRDLAAVPSCRIAAAASAESGLVPMTLRPPVLAGGHHHGVAAAHEAVPLTVEDVRPLSWRAPGAAAEQPG